MNIQKTKTNELINLVSSLTKCYNNAKKLDPQNFIVKKIKERLEKIKNDPFVKRYLDSFAPNAKFRLNTNLYDSTINNFIMTEREYIQNLFDSWMYTIRNEKCLELIDQWIWDLKNIYLGSHHKSITSNKPNESTLSNTPVHTMTLSCGKGLSTRFLIYNRIIKPEFLELVKPNAFVQISLELYSYEFKITKE